MTTALPGEDLAATAQHTLSVFEPVTGRAVPPQTATKAAGGGDPEALDIVRDVTQRQAGSRQGVRPCTQQLAGRTENFPNKTNVLSSTDRLHHSFQSLATKMSTGKKEITMSYLCCPERPCLLARSWQDPERVSGPTPA